MKIIKELKQNYKVGKELWENLSYFVFMQQWSKAHCVSNEIDIYKKAHPILNFFVKPHLWYLH
mgnify:FL=1